MPQCSTVDWGEWMTVVVALVLDNSCLEFGDWSVVLAVYYRHYSDACLICGAVRPAVCPYLVDLLGPKGHWHCLGRCEVVV